MNTNKNIIIGAGVVVIIILLAGFYYYGKNAGDEQPAPGGAVPEASSTGRQSVTKEAVPKDIKIPEVGEKVSAEVAAPSVVTPAAPGVSAKFRKFAIKGEGGVFNPSTIIAKKGDTVHVDFTAMDKTYDITFPDYGMKQTAEKGQTKILEFQALTTGKFTYYCESCGGLNSKAKGYIIVAD